MNIPANAHFFVRSEVGVIDSCNEMVDMDNPNGYIYGYAAFVVMETPRGNRFSHFHSFLGRDEKEVEDQARNLMRRILSGNNTTLTDSLWIEIEPRYGSEASEMYIRQEAAQEAERAAGWDDCP